MYGKREIDIKQKTTGASLMFYVRVLINGTDTWRWNDVGPTFGQEVQRCSGVDPANMSAAFYSVNMYNVYMLLDVFNEVRMLN